MNRAAVITGASSGIGLSIAQKLVEMGYKVFGFGRDFEKAKSEEIMSNDLFVPIEEDILNTDKMLKHLNIIRKEYEVYILVNNAGVGYYGLHEELNANKIKQLVRTNLEAPMIITNYLLRELKKNNGYVFNISSVTATKTNPHGCAYGATKAGLFNFSESLFEEVRKYGVKVISILPDMTSTNLYRNADFTEDDEEMARLLPSEVADAVAYVLEQREGVVVTELTIRPQLHRIKRRKKM